MATEIVPFTDLDTFELARDVWDLTHNNWDLLEARYYWGTLERFGVGLATAQQATARAQDRVSSGVVPFAVKELDSGDHATIGVATLYRGLGFRAIRFNMSPTRARYIPFTRDRQHNGTNVSAWVDEAYATELQGVYEALTTKLPSDHLVWTAEPRDVAHSVHQAIMAAGLPRIGGPERFDVGEGASLVPPFSYLYGDTKILEA